MNRFNLHDGFQATKPRQPVKLSSWQAKALYQPQEPESHAFASCLALGAIFAILAVCWAVALYIG